MKANEVLDNLKRRFPNEPEYHQAVAEVLGNKLKKPITNILNLKRAT